MMKVLIFSLSYFPLGGGAEMAIKEITQRIPNTEFRFELVTLRFNRSHPKFEHLGNLDIYRIGGGFGYLSKILFIPQATWFAMRKQYDFYWVMMTYMLFPIVLLRIFGKKVPYILTLQDGDPFTHVFNRLRIIFFKPLLIYGFKRATKVQVISNFLATWAKQMGYEGVVEVIPNGVPVENFQISLSPNEKNSLRKEWGMNPEDIILTSSSRLAKKNALDDVIRVIALLPEHFKFINFGFGPDKKKLGDLIQTLKLSQRVKLLDYSEKALPRQFKACDIFIRPSLSEGQGISFLEGMAAGLPVIATPVGGIPDFLKDGETGLFCEPKNPESIAKAVTKLMDDPALVARLKENALKMIKERYDWDLIASEMKSKVFRIL